MILIYRHLAYSLTGGERIQRIKATVKLASEEKFKDKNLLEDISRLLCVAQKCTMEDRWAGNSREVVFTRVT